MARLVKNPPAIQETWVQSLGWEDPLEEGSHSSILAWRIPWTVQSTGRKESDTTERLTLPAKTKAVPPLPTRLHHALYLLTRFNLNTQLSLQHLL